MPITWCVAQPTSVARKIPPRIELAQPAPSIGALILLTKPASYGGALGWKPSARQPVTALARDATGCLWVATEEAGVWRYDATAAAPQRWKQFTAADGLGDESAYAITVDKRGRVWVGTLNHGVSVWNGKLWKNYGVLDGPLGERVFDIAICPTDGDVWIATNAGLTRYSLEKDTWSYFTRANGLPSDQVQAIAFDASGNLVVGTQCDGIALAQATEDYKTWRVVNGPKQMPLTPLGTGLPSDLINDVLVAGDGTIYAATTLGLAWSRDKGANWSYVRGEDYAAKAKGLYGGPPKGWVEATGAILSEDYVSCLAEDQVGRIWLGHWQTGNEALKMQMGASGSAPQVVGRESSGLVRAMLPQPSGSLLIARYDEGLGQSTLALPQTKEPSVAISEAKTETATVPLPEVAGVPSLDELNRLLQIVNNHPPTPDTASPILALPDDWMTQGDWRGRYGRYWVSLNAMLAPNNYIWGAGKEMVYYAAQIGPHADKGDGLRHWVHWLYTDDKRSLEMPTIYFQSRLLKKLNSPSKDPKGQKYRRQSEWDDHGEEYPMSQDGPHINVTLRIPKGLYYLSLYNYNKDGQSSLNRVRDYKVSIRPHDQEKSLSDIRDFNAQTQYVQSRWRDFRGGNYKRYIVKGPRDLTIQVNRNYSFNTMLAGLFLDEVSEEPNPYFDTPAPDVKVLQWSPAPNSGTKEDTAAENLWAALEQTKTQDPLWWGTHGRLFYQALARYYPNAQERTGVEQLNALWSRIGTCFYQLNLFPEWETAQEKRSLRTARSIEKALEWDQKSNFNGRGRAAITALRASNQK